MPQVTAWDAIVIGGGVAGGSAATLLARAGQKVLLLEKELATGNKVCGEFISVEAQHYLKLLGVDLLALGASAIENMRLISGRRQCLSRLPFQALSLSRHRLDTDILRLAREAGCDIRYGLTVQELTQTGNHWQVRAADQTLCAPQVFLATGKHELRGWERKHNRKAPMIGLKMHLHLAPAQAKALTSTVELVLCRGGYAGLELVENTTANLCMLLSKAYFNAHGASWKSVLANLATQCPLLAERLQGATDLWPKPLAVSGNPYGLLHRAESNPGGLYRLGDQMAVIPPFCGDGMSIALHTAFAASHYAALGRTREYYQEVSRELKPQLRKAKWISDVIANPLFRHMLLPLASIPGLARKIIYATRVQSSVV